jgi:hypothetical protein
MPIYLIKQAQRVRPSFAWVDCRADFFEQLLSDNNNYRKLSGAEGRTHESGKIPSQSVLF